MQQTTCTCDVVPPCHRDQQWLCSGVAACNLQNGLRWCRFTSVTLAMLGSTSLDRLHLAVRRCRLLHEEQPEQELYAAPLVSTALQHEHTYTLGKTHTAGSLAISVTEM